MVAIIAALAATLYIFGTIVWSIALFSTVDNRLILAVPQYKLVTEVVTSLFSDLPLQHLALKVVFILGTKLLGGFRK
jgi:hypothetical protein